MTTTVGVDLAAQCGISFKTDYRLKYAVASLASRCHLCGGELLRPGSYTGFTLPGMGATYCLDCERIIREAKNYDVVGQWHEFRDAPKRTVFERRIAIKVIDHANALTLRRQPNRGGVGNDPWGPINAVPNFPFGEPLTAFEEYLASPDDNGLVDYADPCNVCGALAGELCADGCAGRP